MERQRRILKQFKMGTTELVVLAVLTQGTRYGYEISQEVFDQSYGFFELKQGFLYPRLRRMEEAHLIQGYWQKSDRGGPARRYYRLTDQGRAHLKASVEDWLEFTQRFNLLLALARPL